MSTAHERPPVYQYGTLDEAISFQQPELIDHLKDVFSEVSDAIETNNYAFFQGEELQKYVEKVCEAFWGEHSYDARQIVLRGLVLALLTVDALASHLSMDDLLSVVPDYLSTECATEFAQHEADRYLEERNNVYVLLCEFDEELNPYPGYAGASDLAAGYHFMLFDKALHQAYEEDAVAEFKNWLDAPQDWSTGSSH